MTQGKPQKRDSTVREKIIAAGKKAGVTLRDGVTTRRTTLNHSGVKETMLGRKESLHVMEKHKRLMLRAKKTDKGGNISLDKSPAKVGAQTKSAPLFKDIKMPAVEKAAKTIEQKNKRKLRSISQQITRGTPAANPRPGKK